MVMMVDCEDSLFADRDGGEIRHGCLLRVMTNSN